MVRRTRLVRWLAAVVTFVVVAGLAYWAGMVTTTPPEMVEQVPTNQATVEVVKQELGRVITLTTSVTRPSTPLALNALSGTVTQVSDSGELGQGDVVYTVGENPVILVRGKVPFWRDLAAGSQGADVKQLQQMLADSGVSLKVDGDWGPPTTRAVRKWQRKQGFPDLKNFPKGSLIASPSTPVSLSVDPKVAWLGAELSGGETVVSVADGDPTFAMEVTQPQAQLLPPGTEVTVEGGATGWPGVITDSQATNDGTFLQSVSAPDGGVLCGTECGELPAKVSTLLTEVALVPPVTGPVVPVAALNTAPGGTTTVDVVTENGVAATNVEVLTIADGLAVVKGVKPHDRVRVFGEVTPGEGVPPDGDATTAP